MKRLYIVALVLQMTSPPPNKLVTKQFIGYRGTETEGEALGLVIKTASEQFPNFGVQSFVTMEIPPEDIKSIQIQQGIP